MTDPRCVWHAPRSADLHGRLWGDYGVVYDAASGNTHLLDALQFELLDRLRQAPRSLETLKAELADEIEPQPDDTPEDEAAVWQDRLLSLHRLGLIQMLEPRP